MDQCRGSTRSGNRCKNTRTTIQGYCHLHRSQTAPCAAGVPVAAAESVPESPMLTPDSSDAAEAERTSPLLLTGILTALILLMVGAFLALGKLDRSSVVVRRRFRFF